MRFDPIPVATIQNCGITGFQEIFLSGLFNSPPDEIARGTVQRLFLQVRRSARSQADWKSWDITHSFRAFPAWKHPELVASVRLYDTYGSEKGKSAAQTAAESIGSCTELLSHLKKVAASNELNFLNAPEELSLKDDPACQSADFYLLTSRFDNPFYWLKTGYWREEAALILRKCRLDSRILHTDITTFYDGIRHREAPLQNSCIQAAVYLCRSPEVQALTVQ